MTERLDVEISDTSLEVASASLEVAHEALVCFVEAAARR
jgi:hypothetical protein